MSRSNFAQVLIARGQYDKAAAIHQGILNVRERLFGSEHPSTLTSVSCLGEAKLLLGLHDEAAALHTEAFCKRIEMFGAEHAHTLISATNLADAFFAQGKFEESCQLHRETLQVRCNVLGADHPASLVSSDKLAVSLTAHGQVLQALGLHQEAFGTMEKVLGKEHPTTLQCAYNLAEAVHVSKTCVAITSRVPYPAKVLDEVVLLQRVLDGRRRLLGTDHPLSTTSAHTLGCTLFSHCRYAEAAAVHRTNMYTRGPLLGYYHALSLDSIKGLVDALAAKGDQEGADSVHPEVEKLEELRLESVERERMNLEEQWIRDILAAERRELRRIAKEKRRAERSQWDSSSGDESAS